MTGTYCVVSGCNAEYSAYKKAGIGVSFHKFPRPIDFVSQTILSEWIRRCGTRNTDPLKNHICSNHFSPTDYERDLQNEYLGLPPMKKLKKTSVPNKNLPHVVLAVTEMNDENQLVSPEGQVQMIKPDESGSSTSFDSSNSYSTISSGDSTDSSMGEIYGDAIEYIAGRI
ncbi:unnamed protein product [Psylliodes chrysocephalus]|uniref:THAP-type domain-containing protein n=1 Tax=Psylliodes chrysocephalus TaxID=3402493 RepID=A0A9P0CFZ2_9CUCU|nr:unnamed protein product [Psylliodes chrysocephala]